MATVTGLFMLACPVNLVKYVINAFLKKRDFINNLSGTLYRFNMFRSLIIIAALVLVYLLIKNRLKARSANKPKNPPISPEDTVQCLECKTYVPHAEAITSENNFFCCKQHQRDWQTRQ
jgi:hypothetical protein